MKKFFSVLFIVSAALLINSAIACDDCGCTKSDCDCNCHKQCDKNCGCGCQNESTECNCSKDCNCGCKKGLISKLFKKTKIKCNCEEE